MTNYIEVVHEYIDEEHGDSNQDVYYAVRPSVSRYRLNTENNPTGPDWSEMFDPGWALSGGTSVYVYDKEDIAGLRKLLDAIEKELDK